MKNRYHLPIARAVFGFPLLVAVATGCGGDGGSSTTNPDLSPAQLVLTNLPTGCPTTETAADLFTSTVNAACNTTNCHGSSGSNSFQLTSAADLHANLVGKKSTYYSAVTFPFVTANDVNKSWLMYKLTGSQGQYGAKMPLGAALTNDQLCKFVAWINSGAP